MNVFSHLLSAFRDGRDVIRFARSCRRYYALFGKLPETHVARIMVRCHYICVDDKRGLKNALRASPGAAWCRLSRVLSTPMDIVALNMQLNAQGKRQWFQHAEGRNAWGDTHRNVIITTDHYGSNSWASEHKDLHVTAALIEECNPDMWMFTRHTLLPGYTMEWRLIHFPKQSNLRDFYNIRGFRSFHRGTCLELIFRPVHSSHYEEHDEFSASSSQEEHDDEFSASSSQEEDDEYEDEQQDNGPARITKKHKSK